MFCKCKKSSVGDFETQSWKSLIWISVTDVCNKILYVMWFSRNALPKEHLANSGSAQHWPKGLSDDQHKPKYQKTTLWVAGKLIYKVS